MYTMFSDKQNFISPILTLCIKKENLKLYFLNSQVKFKKAVSLKEYPKVNEWLTQTENEMRLTLAKLLAEAVKDVSQFSSEAVNPEAYLKWVDAFQV